MIIGQPVNNKIIPHIFDVDALKEHWRSDHKNVGCYLARNEIKKGTKICFPTGGELQAAHQAAQS